MNTLKIVVVFLLAGFMANLAFAQSTEEVVNYIKPGQSRFLLRGYAHSGLEIYKEKNSFVSGSFNPIFLWQQSDRLLFEGELEIELEDGATNIGLEYANVSYLLSKRLIVRLGKFLVPFGIFGDRLHPRWINRLPSNPLGFTHHDQIGPMSTLGAELRGGAPLGTAKINYSVYVVNGPSLNTGNTGNVNTGNEPSGEVGMLNYNNFEDNNKNKAIGGRFGLLPFFDSSVEVGVSAFFGKVGSSKSKYENIATRMFAVDFSLIKNIIPLKSVIDFKAQFNQVNVDKATYPYPTPENSSNTITFDNKNKAYFGRLSVKPAFLSGSFIQRLEFVGRYSVLELSEAAPWGGKSTQWAVGINYWLDWRTVFKISFQDTRPEHAEEGEEEGTPPGKAFLFHWSVGF